ncbi:MAG TPA: septation protein SepH [Kribbella sp.]|nr:septation protein SepH [Kribbella sp.]
MREAKLVGLSQDGKTLILAVAETGEEFAVPVDDRLRAALRGDRARLGQLEIQMESALRPRDIQARIRAGESPESVAAVAQMPMERVMAFAGPVLAERDHVAALAQRASVRRRGGGEGPTRNLGTWVTERLRTRQIDPASADWDAWRRDDGRWAVRVSYGTGEADEHVAMFAYDAPGRYAVPDDDEARWLVGEQAQVTLPQPTAGSERRLAAVADFDLSLAPDHGADSYEAGFEEAISITRERHSARENEPSRDNGRVPRRVHSVPSPDDEPTLIDVPVEQPSAPRPTVRAVERTVQPPVVAPPGLDPAERAASVDRLADRRAEPLSAPTDERPTEASAPAEVADAVGTAATSGTEEASGDAQTAESKKKPARRGSKRASVPSWDEIMFGKKAD